MLNAIVTESQKHHAEWKKSLMIPFICVSNSEQVPLTAYSGSLRTQFLEDICECPVECLLRKMLLWVVEGRYVTFQFVLERSKFSAQKAPSLDMK